MADSGRDRTLTGAEFGGARPLIGRAGGVSVIIPHFEDIARLKRCLDALVPQQGNSEVVVVDNASSVSMEALRRAYPSVRFVVEPERGAAAARNRGVAETRGAVLVFLDCDCVPSENWMDRAVATAREATIVGGRIELFDETPPPRTGAQAFETIFAFDQAAYVSSKGFSVTANLVTTRDLYMRTGPFRSGVSEDLDWCRRAVATGAELIYEQDLLVSHPTRDDWTALSRKWRRLTEEAYGVALSEGQGRGRWIARALAMPVSVLVHAPRVLGNEKLSLGEKLRAGATLARLRLTRMIWMFELAFAGEHQRGGQS